ncbi:MAG: hypothetical protein ACK5QH_16855 [Rubrivivax sp.]
MSSLIFAAMAYITLVLAFGWVGILVSAAHVVVLVCGANPSWRWKRYQPEATEEDGLPSGGATPKSIPSHRLDA